MTDGFIRSELVLRRPGFTLDVSLKIPSRGVTVLFGRSGSGKTTLLRCVAGLEKAERGIVAFNGDIWQDDNKFVPVHKRPLGYVFQEASLFEHLSAGNNLRFAMRRRKKITGDSTRERIADLLGISHLLERFPSQLSGGEKQRVAIARALLINPGLLLMDEPLASLDHNRKQEILPYLENLKEEFDLPILYVTHSPDEVARLADYLVALDDGKVVASGTLGDTLNSLDFPIHLGEEAGAVLNAVVAERDKIWQLAKVNFPGGSLWFRDNGHPVGQKIRIRILARDISLSLFHADNTSIINALPAQVMEIATDEHPGLALVRLRIGDEHTGESVLIARVTHRSANHLSLTEGRKVWAQIKSVAIVE